MYRQGFCGETNRELFQQGIGYRVYSIAYDNIVSQPDTIISLLRMNLSQFLISQPPVSRATLIEREVIRLALSLSRNIKPIDVEHHFIVNHRTAIRWLQSLVAKGWLRPVYHHPGSKVLEYELIREKMTYFF